MKVRRNPGKHFNDDDTVAAANELEDTREFTTGFGLNQPGLQVALAPGNEAGSADLPVLRLV